MESRLTVSARFARLLPAIVCIALVSGRACPKLVADEVSQPKSAGRNATDLYGDRLPHGAIARLGRYRVEGLPEGTERAASVRGAVLFPDGSRLASFGEPADPSHPRVIRIWEISTGKQLSTLDGFERPIRAVDISPDGNILAAGTYEDSTQTGLTHIWNLKTGRLLHLIPEGGRVLRFSRDGSELSLAVRDQTHFFRISDGRESRRFLGPNVALAFAPDNRRVLSISHMRDTVIRIYEPANQRELMKLTGCKRRPPAAIFSPDGRTIAAANGADSVLLWEATTGRQIHKLQGHSGRVVSLAFSPDGRFVVSGGFDKTVRLWEVANGKPVHAFAGHRGPITVVTTSNDGSRLVSGSTDRTLLVWNLASVARSGLPHLPVTPESFEQLWHDLAASAPARAYRAIGIIADGRSDWVAQIEQRLTSELMPIQSKRIDQLIRELDDESDIVRHRATQTLKKLSRLARPLLMKILKQTSSAEVRQRLRRILSASADSPRFSPADARRIRRIIHAMELVHTLESETVLKIIVNQFPAAAVVRDAEETLTRLEMRLSR